MAKKLEVISTQAISKVPIGSLTGATYNPSSRTKPGSARLKHLTKSIEEEGLIYPIAVSEDGTVMDGHRRLAACRSLGWEQVPVIVLKNRNAAKLYADINSTPEIMTGLQVLQVYLQEPEAVSTRARRTLERYEEQFGRTTMRKIVKAGMSYHALGVAQRIAKHVEDERPEFLTAVVNWLLKHRQNRTARIYCAMKLPPAGLRDAIREGRELVVTYA